MDKQPAGWGPFALLSTLRFGSAKIRRKQSDFQEQMFAFCSFLHCLFPGTKIRQQKTVLSVFMPTLRVFADFYRIWLHFFSFPVQRYGSRKWHLQFSVVSFSFLRDFSWYFSFLQFPSGFFRLHAPNTLQRYGLRKGYFPFNCGLRLLLRIIAD